MRFRIHPASVCYLACMALLSSYTSCLCSIAVLAIHEAGHYVAARLVGETFDSIELTPLGGIMTYAEGRSPAKGIRGIIVAGAGPLANYLLLLILPGLSDVVNAEILRKLGIASLATLCVNLLPALPLDGGRICFCVGYYLFRVSALIRFLSCIGMLTGCLFIGMAVYGALAYGMLNCSLIIIGSYLIFSAGKSRTVMLAENLYTVIQERSEAKRKVCRTALYTVPPDTRLIALLGWMDRAEAAVFAYEDATGQHYVTEKMLCRALLQTPAGEIAQIGQRPENSDSA